MRVWEILIASFLIAGALQLVSLGRNGIIVLYACITAVALAVHLKIEGAHWQMGPAYVGVLVFLTLAVTGVPGPRLAGALMGCLALCSCGFSAILPVFQLPKPTGTFPIGTRVLHLVDHSRIERDHQGAPHARELIVQFWYPAQHSQKPLAPYRRRAETTLLSSYQSVTWTHSRWDAPVAQSRIQFPILVFNPAWNGRRTQNTFLVEDLASHGYFVVAVDHTGNSGPTAFPDGHVSQPLPVKEMDFVVNSVETINAAAEDELERQAADDIFILNQLQAMTDEPRSEFYDRLNTALVGAFGHSFGGAVSAQLCYMDRRVQSALDLDGSLFGEVSRQGLLKPFMFISEDTQFPSQEQLERLSHVDRVNAQLDLRDRDMFQHSNGYRIYMHGSSHASFTDGHLFSPCKRLVDGGTIPVFRQFLILREYTRAFFDKTLLNCDPALLRNANTPYPEISFSMHTWAAGD